MSQFSSRFLRIADTTADGKICLDSRKIYIIPTRHGVLYGFAVCLMLLGSLNYNSNLGLLFCFLLAAIGVLGMIHTWRNLLGLTFVVGDALPVFAGAEATFALRILPTNNRDRTQIQFQAGNAYARLDRLTGDAPLLLALRLATTSRGEWPLERLRIASEYPLGLFRAWSYAAASAHAVVYPAPAEASSWTHPANYARAEQGDKGVGADDFVGSRNYREGDNPRHLDWKAFARERGLVTRVFGGDRAEQMWIQWDDFPGFPIEERLSRMCRLIIEAAAREQRYGLRLPDRQIPMACGETHKHRCLSALARFHGSESNR
jgi:uncharacterized protein (DUF58 family)